MSDLETRRSLKRSNEALIESMTTEKFGMAKRMVKLQDEIEALKKDLRTYEEWLGVAKI